MQDFIDKYNKIIAKNFKNLRINNNLSQEKFAERINCSREYVSRVENYKEKLALQRILEISYKFNVSPDYFLTNSND